MTRINSTLTRRLRSVLVKMHTCQACSTDRIGDEPALDTDSLDAETNLLTSAQLSAGEQPCMCSRHVSEQLSMMGQRVVLGKGVDGAYLSMTGC